MTDPAGIIAAVIQQPPQWPGTADRPGVDGTAVWWGHLATMAMPGGPPLAHWIAGTAIEALDQAGWVIVPAPRALPTAGQVRRWLLTHGWRVAGNSGTAGTLWTPPGGGPPVGVPHDSSDPDLVSGAISRVAAHLGQAGNQIIREMLLCDDAG